MCVRFFCISRCLGVLMNAQIKCVVLGVMSISEKSKLNKRIYK